MENATISEIVLRDELGIRVGTIWLDDRDGRGRVVIFGYGAVWTCEWRKFGRAGVELETWLHDCDVDYVARKMRAADWFDAKATAREARALVRRDRRDGNLDAEEARELFDAADRLCNSFEAGQWFMDWMRQTTSLDSWDENPIVYSIDPEFRRLWAVFKAGGAS